MRAARVRVVFSIPDKILDQLFPLLPATQRPPKHLAYVEWFTTFPARPEHDSRLFKIKWARTEGGRLASIVPVALLQRAIHVIPKWGGHVPLAWTSENVLDECGTFLLNPYKDNHSFFNL